MTTPSGISIFDADNHFYEPPEALTRHLPDQYRSQLQYVKLENGRTKLAVGGKISEYIPNPTFDVVARPGAQEEYYRKGNPDGKSRRELFGEPIKSPPGVPRARLTARADERTGHRPHADVPDARQRHRGADEARSRTSSMPPSTASTSGCTRRGSSTTRAASSPRR